MRREAVRCLGLYCYLDGIPTARSSHLLVLRQVLLTPGEASAVKAVAAQVRRKLGGWLPVVWLPGGSTQLCTVGACRAAVLRRLWRLACPLTV